jgi:hypothetical protein
VENHSKSAQGVCVPGSFSVAMFGASNSIARQTLPFFERRSVIIAQQHDASCEAAAARWTAQLTAAAAKSIRTWIALQEGTDLNDFIAAGGDVSVIVADRSETPAPPQKTDHSPPD